VPVIEDCAQSLGSTDRGVLTGGRAPLSIGSFYATKVMTTGHGGLVSTTSPELLESLRGLLDYDNRDDWEPRFSYRMGELPAALGLWQLERLSGWLDRRRAIADYYDGRLMSAGFQAPNGAGRREAVLGRGSDESPNPNFYRYVLRVAEAERAIRSLQAAGVDAKRPVYRPLHHYLGGDYPGAEAAHAQIVSLPIHPSLTDGQAERVADAVSRLPADQRFGRMNG
jgi:dTDP-4-amino-4,6-dideoxygalactose transaminase